MKLSTKGRYAVIAMIELALHNKKGLLPLAELSLSQDISISYLEQLFARLRGDNLVSGVRGPRGGYRLARPAHEISIADIVKAVDEKANPANQPGVNGSDDPRRTVHGSWIALSGKIHDFLDEISLADAISEHGAVIETEKTGIIGSTEVKTSS